MSDIIVVGLTDRPVADRLLDWATQRATDRRQPLRLVSVLGGETDVAGARALVDEFLQVMRNRTEQVAARLRDRGLEVEVIVQPGNPTERLIEAASGAALLAIGSDYRGPNSGTVRGVHGVRVASAAPCPVVTVPDFDIRGRSGVVIGIDGSSISENALAWAAAEADRLREPLIAIGAWIPIPHARHMGPYPHEYLTNMQRNTEEVLAIAVAGLRSRYPDLEIVNRAERGHPSSVISDAAAGARMAVLGTHGRGAFKRLLLGSVSHEVLGRLPTLTAVVR